MIRIETKRFREAFTVNNDGYRVLLNCEHGEKSHTHITHYWLEPAYAKELAHALLAATAKLEQRGK